MKMRALVVSLSLAALLPACATLIEGQQQTITLKTPGETEAVCYLDNGTLQYRLYSGDTKTVTKNHQDIEATCFAPGNREKRFTIPWIIEPWTAGNVANGIVPGVTYDVLSKSVYAYPDVVTVDFGDQRVGTYAAPDYATGNKYIAQEHESYAPGAAKGVSTLQKKDPSELLGQSNPFKRNYTNGEDAMSPLPPSKYSGYAGGTAYDPASEEK